MVKTPKVEVNFACGRAYLAVNGFVAAVEGDMCRDATLPGTHWNKDLLERVASGANDFAVKAAEPFSSLPAVDAEAQYLAAKQKDHEEFDAWSAKQLAETWAVVAATHEEMHNLWERWSMENRRNHLVDDKRPYVYWGHESRGLMERLGAFRFDKKTMPIILSCFWAKLRVKPTDPGKLVLFWEMTSQVTDSRMAEKFLAENCPNKVIDTNATNFHNVVHQLARESR